MNTPKMKNNELVSSTRFEDLSNELIYEIFNYLDSWEIYKTFVQLNIRFQYLFRSDIFRLKINLPLLAKRNVFLRCEKLLTIRGTNVRNQRKKCRNQLIACLDDLSNEIFYEIFDYLNGCEIEIFYFIYCDRMNNDNQYSAYSHGLNQFSSSFWIPRRWIFNVQIDNTNIKYMIYPYRNTWYNYILADKNIQYSTSLKLISSDILYDDP
ncbi:unnamed protein product [Rotaria magnacalcarata]|uniref:F-box domain-containing protein n=1 Tax=Rotaria magnacalcarata TaxID=392030 RepID=A0A819RN77_9BILA|nr:unnamed protein product [Rotaria magnacalcarata]